MLAVVTLEVNPDALVEDWKEELYDDDANNVIQALEYEFGFLRNVSVEHIRIEE